MSIDQPETVKITKAKEPLIFDNWRAVTSEQQRHWLQVDYAVIREYRRIWKRFTSLHGRVCTLVLEGQCPADLWEEYLEARNDLLFAQEALGTRFNYEAE